MAAAELAQRHSGAEQARRPLSEYPGPQADIVGSTMRRGHEGGWVRDYYYRGHVDIPGGEHVIGYSGRETKVEHPQRPGKAIVVFDIAERQPVTPIPLRKI